MNLFYEEFKIPMGQFDKERCAAWVLDILETNRMDLNELYLEVFEPCLSQIASNGHPQEIDIWEEHMRSSIIRSMIELCYPYVLQKKYDSTGKHGEKARKRVIVCCLEEEQHDIGARMSADFLTLLGFEVYFIGANTAKEQIAKAMLFLRPDIVAISISNFFHLTKLQKTIDYIHQNVIGSYKIAVGGYAITYTPMIEQKVTPDYFLRSIKDLEILLDTGYKESVNQAVEKEITSAPEIEENESLLEIKENPSVSENQRDSSISGKKDVSGEDAL